MEVTPGFTYKIKNNLYKVPENLVFTDKQHCITQKQIDGLYDLLQVVTTLFNKKNIKFFAIAGTLISVIRHKCFMPWDDDIDVGFFKEDYEKIKKLKFSLFRKGYNLIECVPGFVIQNIMAPSVAMDLFMIDYNNRTGHVEYAAPMDENGGSTFMAAKYWPKEYFLESEIKNMKYVKFCTDLDILVPDDSENILKRSYSKNVMTEVRGVPSTKVHIFRPVQAVIPFVQKFVPLCVLDHVTRKTLM